MGVISLAVLGAAFEVKGDWRRDAAGGLGAEARGRRQVARPTMVTFHTLKRRELAEIAHARKTRTRRKPGATHVAPATRVAAVPCPHGAHSPA